MNRREFMFGSVSAAVATDTITAMRTEPKAVQDAVLAAQEAVAGGKITVPSAIGDTTKGAETLRDSMMP